MENKKQDPHNFERVPLTNKKEKKRRKEGKKGAVKIIRKKRGAKKVITHEPLSPNNSVLQCKRISSTTNDVISEECGNSNQILEIGKTLGVKANVREEIIIE